jgi:predicted nucleotidyltransferase
VGKKWCAIKPKGEGEFVICFSLGDALRDNVQQRQATFRMNRTPLIQTLQDRVPNLLAIYAFGSQVQGTAGPESDLDLAVLVAGYAEPLTLWALSGDLADTAGCPVDLLDLRAASTVLQYQVISNGQCWWVKDAQAALFEAAILSDKTALDTARAGVLADIQKKGTIYGR